MNSIIVFESGGRIIRHGIYCEQADPSKGEMQIDGSAINISDQYVDEVGRCVVDMPLRPSMAHDFDYATKQWVRNVDEAWRLVRQRRDNLLSACDWTQLPDVPTATQELWRTYRQELRDITQQSDPFAIVWPAQKALLKT